MNKKEKYLISFLLIALSLSLLVNVYLINNNLFPKIGKNEKHGFLSIIQIYKLKNDKWELVFEKSNDILKQNFANLTRLFFANWRNKNLTQTVYLIYLSKYLYANLTKFYENDYYNIYQCNIEFISFNTINNEHTYVIFGYNHKVGVNKDTFKIGLGNDTSIFSNFPSVFHNTTIIDFGYGLSRNKCAESSHEFTIGIENYEEIERERNNNVLKIKYIAYWQNSHPQYTIKYVRLYIPFLYSQYPTFLSVKLLWLLIAEETVNNVISYNGETLRFVYTIQINL
jgi:hypothetical protein